MGFEISKPIPGDVLPPERLDRLNESKQGPSIQIPKAVGDTSFKPPHDTTPSRRVSFYFLTDALFILYLRIYLVLVLVFFPRAKNQTHLMHARHVFCPQTTFQLILGLEEEHIDM